MRTQRQNPAYQRFQHLLPQSGLYPARWVDIFSNTDDTLRYSDVEVVFIPRGAGEILDNNFWREFAAYNKRWLGDLGNSVSGWMEPGGLNPEKVFGGMLIYGFTNKSVLDNAIREFAQIEECDWARQMSEGMMSDVLKDAGQNNAPLIASLRAQARRQHSQWAKDMLETIVDD